MYKILGKRECHHKYNKGILQLVFVADGWYIITEPLAKGNHTIYFKSSLLPDPTTGAEGYATDIKYNIIAE